MSSDIAIEMTDVKKTFRVYNDKGHTLKDRILSKGRSKYQLREVLKGISLTVKKGEAVGLIGKNGCGKSTTLKLLTKIMYPDSGKIKMNGRISSLLELGAGFHPDLSGKENIYMNASVFGLSHKEIDKRILEIIKFSELENFIDNPIRTYSSGMYMRLAFAVAINVNADILLIDEILAVGDINFQTKCFEKLKEIKKQGTTIVIVSHSLGQIEEICDRSYWLKDGIIKEEGAPVQVHKHYLGEMEAERLQRFQDEVYKGIESDENASSEIISQTDQDEITQMDEVNQNSQLNKIIQSLDKNLLKLTKSVHEGSHEVFFNEIYMTNGADVEKLFFQTGEDVHVYLKYKANSDDLRGTLCLTIYRDDGLCCYGTNSFVEHMEVKKLNKEGFLLIKLKELSLLPGRYYLSLGIQDENAELFDFIDNVVYFHIYSDKDEQGVFQIKTEWTFE